MVRAYWLFFSLIFLVHTLNAAHIIFPQAKLQHYCAVGEWKSAEKLFTKKLKKNPDYKWDVSVTMLCMIRAFEDNKEFLTTLIEYNENRMIALPDNLIFDCVRKKHYTVFRIILEKSDDDFSKSLQANILLLLIKDKAPDDIFDAIFERYHKYLQIHQRLPVFLEQRQRGSLETVLGYAFSHGHIKHARMLLQNGADFAEGILKMDVFGYYLMEKTEWDSAIVALWCEQDNPIRRLKHHVFHRDKKVASLLIQFFLRALDSPLFAEFDDIATLFYYQELLSCLASIGHNNGHLEFDKDEWLMIDDSDDDWRMRNRYFFDAVKKEMATMTAFLQSMPRFQPCKAHNCPAGAFSMFIYLRGTNHIECELCFHLQCISCGKRHPQAPCKKEKP